MFQNVSKFSKHAVLVISCATLANHYNSQEPIHAANNAKRNFPTSAEYPDLHLQRNILSRHLTLPLYSKLRNRTTTNGYTLDDAIQTGVDNIGQYNTSGVVAGDEESYTVFADLFDKIIEERHPGFKKGQKHQKNLNPNNLKNTVFDSKYVVNFRIKASRNISGYCFTPFVSRGERRDIETLLVKIFYNHNIDEDVASEGRFNYKGTYVPLSYMTEMEEAALKLSGFWLDKPVSSSELSSNYQRDWPDARGIWVNDQRNLSVYLNRKDHLLISVIDSTNDFRHVFQLFGDFLTELEKKLEKNNFYFAYDASLGYLTSSPSSLGTTIKFSTFMKLPNLSKDSRLAAILKKLDLNIGYRLFDENKRQISVNQVNETSIVEISSSLRMGKSEVQYAQMFIDSISKLIDIEKKLENKQEVDLL